MLIYTYVYTYILTERIDTNFDVLEISFAANDTPNRLCLFGNSDSSNSNGNSNSNSNSNDNTNVYIDDSRNENTWHWLKRHICISKTPDRDMAKEFWFGFDKGCS